jgi:multidrug efflux pump subunit AcrB
LLWELALGKQTRSRMTMAVIGGLITSRLLTLVVIPLVFTYFDAW